MDRYIDASEIKLHGTHFITAVAAYRSLNPIVDTLLADHTARVNAWDSLWTTALSSRSSLEQTGGPERRADSKELTDARVAWFRDYKACQRIMEGLLIKAGREDELELLFLDMQVPRRISSIMTTAGAQGSGSGNGTTGTASEGRAPGAPG